MARNGPGDDFYNQPTQFGNWGEGAQPPRAEPSTVEHPEPAPESVPEDEWAPPDENEPTAWYRKPAALIAWVAAVLLLIGLIVYGVLELIHDRQGSSHTPSTSTIPSTTTTTTTTPPPTTTTTTEPPTSTAPQPPAQQPTYQPTQQPTRQPTQPPSTHRHHLPALPPEITIPDGPVITLPPGLS
ncbi:hypothetical protein [Mycobacterium sp. Marseille-P9652]|uniref:hypothetical protein n=1 Tax=Mycobacterium sp. Marseille-P9652 TaxID=2654950 RepID=UPI0012E86C6F|nr:hypothetical protein [Mycobacterium sp. Marseille-P9652]